MGCADSREQVVLLYPVIIRCRLSGQVQVVQIQIHKIIPLVRMKVYQETAMTLGRTRRNVMIPLKLGMAAVLMPDLDPGKAEKAMREAAASAEIAAKAMARMGEALAAEAAVETAAETAAEVIAEAAAEVIAEAIAETAVERPAVITEAAEMTKMKDRFRIFV